MFYYALFLSLLLLCLLRSSAPVNSNDVTNIDRGARIGNRDEENPHRREEVIVEKEERTSSAHGRRPRQDQEEQQHTIVGGHTALAGSYPWFTQVFSQTLICGGSLIHGDIVLTAAHCSRPVEVFVAGDTIGYREGQQVAVDGDNIVNHPNFDGTITNGWDVRVVKLEEWIGDSITPVELNRVSTLPVAFTELLVMGFGNTVSEYPDRPNTISNQLQVLSTPAVGQTTCSLYWNNVVDISDEMLCHGARLGEGQCTGDSGGPLVDRTTGRQVGIISFGISGSVDGVPVPRCGSGNVPDVATRISAVYEWIDEQICGLSDQPHDGCSSSSSSLPCFSPEATVDVVGKGSQIPMKELVVGDRVLTKSGAYKTIFTIDHYHRTKPTRYLQIYTENDGEKHNNKDTTYGEEKEKHLRRPLEISPKHMLYRGDKLDPVPASELKIGDTVQTLLGSSTKVTDIKTIVRNGLYNPITSDGTIVVDGIIASSYSSYTGTSHMEIAGWKLVSFQTIADMAYRPYRTLCMGIISLEACNQHQELAFVNKCMKRLYGFYSNQRAIIQLVILLGYVVFFSCMGLVFSPYGLFAVIILLALGYIIMEKKR